MAITRLLFVAAAASLLCAADAQAASRSRDDAASVERGRRLAQRNCAQCHTIQGRAESPKPAAPPFSQLYRRYPGGALEEAFGAGLLTRHPAMPQIRLLPGEIIDLTAYVKSLRASDQARAPSALRPVRLAVR